MLDFSKPMEINIKFGASFGYGKKSNKTLKVRRVDKHGGLFRAWYIREGMECYLLIKEDGSMGETPDAVNYWKVYNIKEI